ncbi:MAG: TlpA family protein disulfide reductase [Deltaproteobacteria bacterium]|nr:TlpA family protein disulfide reductase [Deltaproteobacteria bacterium]
MTTPLAARIAALGAFAAMLVVACAAPGAHGGSAQPASPGVADSARPSPPTVGAKALPFTRPALTGGTVSIPTKKEATVLFFFATWSAPDMKLVALMEETARAYPEAAIVAMCVDDDDRFALEAAKSRGATYSIAWDVRHELASAYRLDTVPLVFLLDADGVIRFVHRGLHDGEHEEIESELATLVKSDVCARPVMTSDGPACFRQCERIAKQEAACGSAGGGTRGDARTTPDCRKRCAPSGCREKCTRENERRNAALALCRQRPPRGRDACEAACHSEQHNAAIDDCTRESAGQRELLAECEAVCGVGPCRAACRR